MVTLAFEIAIPVEIEFADVPQGVSIIRSKKNYQEFAERGRNWPIYIIGVVASVGVNCSFELPVRYNKARDREGKAEGHSHREGRCAF
jgi:hypothetical protein